MTLQRASGAEFSFVHSSEVLATNSRLIRTLEKPENPEGGINVMGINCPHEKVRFNVSAKIREAHCFHMQVEVAVLNVIS